MKSIQWIPLVLLALVAMSCEVTVVEPVVYDARDEFVGYLGVDEYSETFRKDSHYDIHITKAFGNHVYIHNFYGVDIRVIAEVRGGRLVIPYQEVGPFEIEGSAYRSGNHIDFSYSVFDHRLRPRVTDFCNSVAYW